MNPVTYESRDHVATITINRPDARNAIDAQACDALRGAWVRLAQGDDRVAILTGTGDLAFCAGVDLHNPPKSLAECLPGLAVPIEKPVIAAVSGWCIGGGGLFLLLCDLAVAAEGARFRFPEAGIGDFGGIMTGLVSRIPHKIAMEMLLLGREIGAQRAYEVGLVNEVTPAGGHLDAAREMALTIAAHAPLVTRAVKRFADLTLARGPLERVYGEISMISAIRNSEDRNEGMRAVLEKRQPKFTGR